MKIRSWLRTVQMRDLQRVMKRGGVTVAVAISGY